MKRRALLVYRIVMVLAAVVFCAFAVSNEVAFGINAVYFPQLSNPVVPWHTKLFIALALICAAEAVFALLWRTTQRWRSRTRAGEVDRR